MSELVESGLMLDGFVGVLKRDRGRIVAARAYLMRGDQAKQDRMQDSGSRRLGHMQHLINRAVAVAVAVALARCQPAAQEMGLRQRPRKLVAVGERERVRRRPPGTRPYRPASETLGCPCSDHGHAKTRVRASAHLRCTPMPLAGLARESQGPRGSEQRNCARRPVNRVRRRSRRGRDDAAGRRGGSPPCRSRAWRPDSNSAATSVSGTWRDKLRPRGRHRFVRARFSPARRRAPSPRPNCRISLNETKRPRWRERVRGHGPAARG